MSSLDLTKRDYGPKRRIFDKGVIIMMAFFIGWSASAAFYDVHAIPDLKTNSWSWFQATTDRFDGICRAIYGPSRAPQ